MIGNKSTLDSPNTLIVNIERIDNGQMSGHEDIPVRLNKVQLFAKNANTEYFHILDNVPFLGDVTIKVLVGDYELVQGIDFALINIPFNNTYKTILKIINPTYISNLDANVRIIALRNNEIANQIYDSNSTNIHALNERRPLSGSMPLYPKDTNAIKVFMDGITNYIDNNKPTDGIYHLTEADVWQIMAKTDYTLNGTTELLKYLSTEDIAKEILSRDIIVPPIGSSSNTLGSITKKIIYAVDIIAILKIVTAEDYNPTTNPIVNYLSEITPDSLSLFIQNNNIRLLNKSILDSRIFALWCNPNTTNLNTTEFVPEYITNTGTIIANILYPGYEIKFYNPPPTGGLAPLE